MLHRGDLTFSDNIVEAANALREAIQDDERLKTIDDGESVAILLWWSFLVDHSEVDGEIPVDLLARAQLEAFIEYAKENFAIKRPVEH